MGAKQNFAPIPYNASIFKFRIYPVHTASEGGVILYSLEYSLNKH